MEFSLRKFRILIALWAFCFQLYVGSIQSQCLEDQRSLLIQLKGNLTFNSTVSTKLVYWNSSTDCCAWSGVTCNGDGHVIGLRLNSEHIFGPIPEILGNFSDLTSLDLSSSGLYGKFPEMIFHLPQLKNLYLSNNEGLYGLIPEFPENASLQTLDLRRTSLGGHLPQSIGNLTELVSLDFSYNNFSGPMPSFSSAKNLSYINLSNNHLSGSILSTNWSDFPKLFSLDLSNNKLEGPFPTSLFQLENLTSLILSSNNLSGPLNLTQFQQFKNLKNLRLSYNSFSINISGNDPTSFPKLEVLGLASCNLTGLPAFLKNQPILSELDLSNNQIGGVVPDWLWTIGSLQFLNLSQNLLLDLQAPPIDFIFSLVSLDLSNNKLQGELLTKIKIGYGTYIYLSNNFIQGSIPQSICNVSLGLLDLSNNSLNGVIPQCLFGLPSLNVLNLRGNNLSGNISDTFPSDCRSFQTLDLNGNQLEGEIPRSLTNCKLLEVLDLGNNRINDVFPCHLKNLSSLRVLVLRSNNFHGPIGCPDNNSSWTMLQIVDLAYNNFRGQVPAQFLRTWKAMSNGKNELQSIRFNLVGIFYYQQAIKVTMKGQEYEMARILTVFTSIDFSCNKLEGVIPEVMGEFKALHILNMSHNAFTGQIPISFGDLRRLESMDLSSNHLGGKIPQELTDLNFLVVLNLSNNQLVGRIPTSSQFQTFSNDSFQENDGLCGFPLTKSCGGDMKQCDVHSEESCRVDHSDDGSLIEWNFLSVELGIVFGLGGFVLRLMFWRNWRIWYFRHVDVFLSRFLPCLNRRSGNRSSRISRRIGAKTQLKEKNKMAGEVAVQPKVS